MLEDTFPVPTSLAPLRYQRRDIYELSRTGFPIPGEKSVFEKLRKMTDFGLIDLGDPRIMQLMNGRVVEDLATLGDAYEIVSNTYMKEDGCYDPKACVECLDTGRRIFRFIYLHTPDQSQADFYGLKVSLLDMITKPVLAMYASSPSIRNYDWAEQLLVSAGEAGDSYKSEMPDFGINPATFFKRDIDDGLRRVAEKRSADHDPKNMRPDFTPHPSSYGGIITRYEPIDIRARFVVGKQSAHGIDLALSPADPNPVVTWAVETALDRLLPASAEVSLGRDRAELYVGGKLAMTVDHNYLESPPDLNHAPVIRVYDDAVYRRAFYVANNSNPLFDRFAMMDNLHLEQ